MADRSTRRIAGEIGRLNRANDLSLAVAFRNEDVRKVRSLIIGPPDTPYEFGFFEFDFKFSRRYPDVPPIVKLRTTNNGRTRFNPNLYNCGKVCLSILGTWHGESGEEWSPAQGLESVLISIQSLMSEKPYENEPGFEGKHARPEHEADAKAYAAKVHHETLRISVINRLEEYLGITQSSPPDPQEAENDDFGEFEPFTDLCKQRFLWYYYTYLLRIDEAIIMHGPAVAEGVSFTLTPFEGDSNSMEGTFDYAKLKLRLHKIQAYLKDEMEQWIIDGAKARDSETTIALEFGNKFKHVVDEYRRSEMSVHFEMIDQNPFVWQITLLGKPLTNLDGGLFHIRMIFHRRFPDIQPRVRMENTLFHHRINPDGFLCYVPADLTDISSHVRAIIESIEDESPPYDPRILVHPEASKLFWGTPDQKKLYNRRLRTSARESSHEVS